MTKVQDNPELHLIRTCHVALILLCDWTVFILRYLNFTNTNDARRYQHFVKGGGANLVIDLLVARPTPEKKFPEVVPILRECGKFCEEGSPESLKNLIHITHAFEDP